MKKDIEDYYKKAINSFQKNLSAKVDNNPLDSGDLIRIFYVNNTNHGIIG